MTYVRPSSLGVAEFCPRSAELSSQSGIGRSAVISQAWHAKLAGNDTLIGKLHPDERKEVATWGSPTTAIVATHHERLAVDLDYESAEKELHVQVLERDTLITEGTLDFAWVREVNGQRWAFVADLKRSTWAIPDGPDCLQLAAYGHAYAVLRSCVGYTPGLWSGTDSDWSWGKPIDLSDPEALDLWLRLKRAARNDWRLMPEGSDKARYTTGAHCKACYGRMRCPEWAMLGSEAAFTKDHEINEDNAAQLLLRSEALSEAAERIKDHIKVFAERGGVVKDPATGKVYLPTQCQGRMGLDKAAAAAAGVDLTKFERRGKPYTTFGWRK